MDVTFEYRPLPIHTPFHTSTTYERMLFGAFGSGKTYGIIAEVIAWCLEQPGIRGLVARKTIPELRDTTEPIFRELLPHELWKSGEERRTGGHMESFTFSNGSKVLFRSLDDWNKHRSLNVGFIAYDECNEIDEETYMGMSSRVRQRDITAEARRAGYSHEITRRGIWGATNPAGHDWLWRRFVNDKTRHESTEYFRSTTLDNPFLPPEYVRSLLDYPAPWVRRYVLCEFDDFAGVIYEDWGWDTHVVPHPKFEPDQIIPVRMALDPGTRNPTAALWAWVDSNNRRLVIIDCYQQGGLSADLHAAAWRAIEARQKMRSTLRISDPTITTRDRGTSITLHSQYAKLGFYFQLGPARPEDRIPALGRAITLRRIVCSDRCMEAYEAIKNYQWRDITPAERASGEAPREVPLKNENSHIADCAQYLVARDAPAPTMHKPVHPDQTTDEIHKAIRKNIWNKYMGPPPPGKHDLGNLLV